MRPFKEQGKVSFIVGGAWGSEAKGCAAASVAVELAKSGDFFDVVTTGAGAQAGHTSIHKGKKRVVYHLPTAPLIAQDELGAEELRATTIYLNAGAIIDPIGLEKELNENPLPGQFFIHPMAAVITDECREAEMRSDSSRTKIASTRKGVGEALARKVTRSGMVAKDHPFLKQFVQRLDLNLMMRNDLSVLVEVPQGVSLSLNHSKFYPYTTSRDCIPSSAMGEAGIHPSFYHSTLVVLRTFPIRVGHIVEDGMTLGESGPCYPDQAEVSWEELGVEAEITTVTKRVRRVFTFSYQQIVDTFNLCLPDYVFLSFCNYVKDPAQFERIVNCIYHAAKVMDREPPKIVYQWGPTTEDIGDDYAVA